MPSKLYRVDNRRLTLRECWNQTRSANVLILWLLKLLRIRISLPPMPYPEAVHQLALDRDALPPTAVSRLDPLVVELESEGFHSPRYYRYASSRGRTEIFIAALIQSRGEAIARVMYVIGHESHPPLERTRVFILSVLSDGSWLVTSPQRAEFEPSPGVEVIRLLDAPPARLAQAHLEALNSRRAANPPIPVPTQEEAETVADRYERSCFDHGIRRGLYVPLTEAEEANEQEAVVAAEHAKAEVGSKHADVLVEIERLQNPKSSLKNALWILGVSLVAFVVLGGAKWEWEFVLLLIPILLFHEAGHWLAMRMFGYRNLRMFFIPLFGAAVSGQNFNVAGWKKALVSLAGPAPGLLLGVVLAIASLFAGPPWLEKFALLTVVLNAFNLLPFVPLDGGWFLNATVFCRRAWLETGFKLLAVVALVLASVQTGERLWGFLAILMALSLRTTWRIGRLAEQLRASGLPTQSLDRQTIPPDSLATLVSAVKGSTKQPRPVKIVASETLDLFERLNARPPGLLATLALLTAYVGTIILGFLGFGLASFARTSGLDLLDEDSVIAVDPPLTLTCDDTATATTEAAWPDPTNRVVLIGIHPDAETARSQWTELTNTWPSTVARVGSVLVAMYSKAAVDQIARARELLAPLGTNFIQKDSGDDPYVLLDLTCQLPLGLSGTNLFAELEDYFALPSPKSAQPPWADSNPLSAEQSLARHTWKVWSKMEREVEKAPAMKAQRAKMMRAFRRSDTNQLQSAISALEAKRAELLAISESQLTAPENSSLDAAIVEFKRTHRDASTDPALSRPLLSRLAVVPDEEAEHSPTIRALAALGAARRDDDRLVLPALDFREPSAGLAALVDWLCLRGATDIRFEIHSF